MREELRPVRFTERDQLHAHRSRLLHEHVADLQQRSPWYREVFKQHGIDPVRIASTDDITTLPFTTKDDLAGHNERFLCVPRSEVIEHVATSGSLGAPVPILLTERDLERLTANEHNSLAMAGVTSSDVVQVMTTLNKRFMAGLAYALGLRSLGAGIVRSGPGAIAQQWELIHACDTSVLIVVPSFLLRLLEHARTHGIDPSACGVRKAICIGEPIRSSVGEWNALGRRIREQWDIELLGTYASTEMATACTETHPGSGHIIRQQLLLVEVIGDDGRPVANGGTGEVVVTPLHVQGMPLLRFRTGDVCTWHEGTLPDGSFGQWLGPVLGRLQQRLKLKGTTLFPARVIDVINDEPAISNFVILREQDGFGLDQLRIMINATGSGIPAISDRIAERLNVRPEIAIATDAEIDRLKWPDGARKPRLFVDLANTIVRT